MDRELEQMIRKKNEYLKKIEEKKRMMELINNPTIKDILKPLDQMKKNDSVKKIQRYWRFKKLKEKNNTIKVKNNIDFIKKSIQTIQKNSTNNPRIFSNENDKEGTNYLYKLIIVQRAIRKFLFLIKNRKTKQKICEEYNKRFFSNIRHEKINELKERIVNKIKLNNIGYKNYEMNFQEVLNDYMMKYKKFMDDFPNMHYTKEDNFNYFYKCKELLDFIETNKNLNGKFRDFPLDQRKNLQIKIKTNKILDSIENKMWWYKISEFDDFESSNTINEIDNHFDFNKIL